MIAACKSVAKTPPGEFGQNNRSLYRKTGILYVFYPINPKIINDVCLYCRYRPYLGTNLKSEVSFRSEILNP